MTTKPNAGEIQEILTSDTDYGARTHQCLFRPLPS